MADRVRATYPSRMTTRSPLRVSWNGRDLPEEFASLPPGEYELIPFDDVITDDDERAIAAARAAVERGEDDSSTNASARLRQRFA